MYISRSEANAPQKFPLLFEEGDYYLMVLSCHSDNFRTAKNSLATMSALSEEPFTQIDIIEHLLASVVVEWNLPKKIKQGECNKDNVKNFLHEYPEICDTLNNFIAIKDNFLIKK